MKFIVKFTLLLLLLLAPVMARANDSASGFCENGNKSVSVGGLTSTTKVQQSYPLCTVTVYNHGTVVKATLYSDNNVTPTPLANPFTATAAGFWQFYAANGRYDVVLSGTITPSITISDVVLDGVITNLNFLDAGAVCNGSTNDTAALSAANTKLVALGGGNLVIPGGKTCLIGTNTTTSAGVRLVFEANSLFTVSTGITLTINGGLQCGSPTLPTQCFNLSGTGSVVGNAFVSTYMEWFGGKSDGGTTNNLPALKAAYAAVSAGGVINLICDNSYYMITMVKDSGGDLPLTKNLTVSGPPGSTCAKIKAGPESAAAGDYRLFRKNSGYDLTVENVTAEGPTTLAAGSSFYFLFSPGTPTSPFTGTGCLYLNNIVSTKFNVFLKSESATNYGDMCIEYDHVNASIVINNGVGWNVNQIGGNTIVKVRRSSFTNPDLPVTVGLPGYDFYIAETSAVDMEDVDIGAAQCYGVQFFGASSGAPYAIFNNVRFTGPFGTALAPCAGLLTSQYTLTQITGSTFLPGTAGAGINLRGDTTITGGLISSNGRGIVVSDTAGSSTVIITGTKFINAPIVDAMEGMANWQIDNSYFALSGAAATSNAHIVFGHKFGGLTVTNSVFTGSGGDAIIEGALSSNIALTRNKFYNPAGLKAILQLNGATFPTWTLADNYFQTSADAFQFNAAPAAFNMRLPRASKTTAASAGTVTLDFNYDSYLFSGATNIANANFGTGLAGCCSTNLNIGPVTLIPDTGATWAITGAGNIYAADCGYNAALSATLCNGGNAARPVDVPIMMQLNATRGKWMVIQ